MCIMQYLFLLVLYGEFEHQCYSGFYHSRELILKFLLPSILPFQTFTVRHFAGPGDGVFYCFFDCSLPFSLLPLQLLTRLAVGLIRTTTE